MRPLSNRATPLQAPTNTSNHTYPPHTLPSIFTEVQRELNSMLTLSQIRTIYPLYCLSLRSPIIAPYSNSVEDAIGPAICDSHPNE